LRRTRAPLAAFHEAERAAQECLQRLRSGQW
jgi:hypothetical protein